MLDFLLHVDERLVAIVDAAGPWSYAVLFAIIFAETGLVATHCSLPPAPSAPPEF
jgi:membrane-associated protein